MSIVTSPKLALFDIVRDGEEKPLLEVEKPRLVSAIELPEWYATRPYILEVSMRFVILDGTATCIRVEVGKGTIGKDPADDDTSSITDQRCTVQARVSQVCNISTTRA